MYDDFNLAKLPQLYDYFTKNGYSKSFNEFLEELFQLISNNKNILTLDSQHNLHISHTDNRLNSLIQYFDNMTSLSEELKVYKNEELDLAKQHLVALSSWCRTNKIKVPNVSSISSFSDLFQSLVHLSSIFILYD